MKKIPLVNRYGEVLEHALVDDEDYERINAVKWRLQMSKKTTTRYAVHSAYINGKSALFLMHRDVLGLPRARTPEVDHRDMNGLNNQKDNLRAVSHSQNQWNRTAYRCNRTGMKGVTFHRGRFVSRIRRYGKLHYLGTYGTAAEAHAEYVAVSKEMHGEFHRA